MLDDLDVVEGALLNTVHNTKPLVFHGNGLSKLAFNTLANYLAHSWTPTEGCISCHENNIHLDKVTVFNITLQYFILIRDGGWVPVFLGD